MSSTPMHAALVIHRPLTTGLYPAGPWPPGPAKGAGVFGYTLKACLEGATGLPGQIIPRITGSSRRL